VGDRVFFMGPLYPYFLAIVYRIGGPDLLLVKIIQSILGGLTAGATFLLARECFGVVAGLVAGMLAALYVPFVFYDNSILFPVLATLLNVLMLYFLCRAVRRGQTYAYLAAGLLAGLSAAGNASVLAFMPLAALLLLARRGPAIGERTRGVLILAAGIAVVVLPITIRNYAVGGDFVPLTSNAGINLYIGNNARSTGAYVKPERLDVYTDPEGRTLAEEDLGRPLRPSEVSRWWMGRAADYVRQDPGGFAFNLIRKAFLFWSVYEVPQIEHLPFEKRYSAILRIPSPTFGIICPLAVIGMALSLRRIREAWLPFLFSMVYSATIIAFFVVARYRLPVVPVLMAFAGYAVFRAVQASGRRRHRELGQMAAGFVAVFALIHINFFGIDPMSGYAQSYYRLGIIHEDKGQLDAAVANYRKALSMDPEIAAAHVNLGILLSRTGSYDQAKTELLHAVRLKDDYAKAYYNLGLVYAEQAVSDSALKMMDRAIELRPDYELAVLGKGAIHFEMARFDEAESLLVHVASGGRLDEPASNQAGALLKVLPARRRWVQGRTGRRQQVSDRHLLRGDNLLALGLVERGLEAYQRAIGADSLSSVALGQAATLYFNRGELERARHLFSEVLRADPEYPGAHFALGVIAFRQNQVERACREFQAELAVDPESSKSHINLAMCYEEHLEDLRRAAYHIGRYIELTGGTPELRDHLKELERKISDE
jgi:tetratricopeptide (TPR) repeat protein